jgi:hypothetical protein
MMAAEELALNTAVTAAGLAAHLRAPTVVGLAAHLRVLTVVGLAAHLRVLTVVGLAARLRALTAGLQTRSVSNRLRPGSVRLRSPLSPIRDKRFGSWFLTERVRPAPKSGRF